MAGFPSYHVKRADEDPRPGLIDAQLINDLLTADLVIADLSSNNPNAFYEIGIRHMAQKPIIHIQLADEKIPFDLSLYRSIKFSLAVPSDIDKAQVALKAQVEAIHAADYQVENPVTKARGVVQLKEHATPPEQVLLDQIADLNRRLLNIEQFSISPLSVGIMFLNHMPVPIKEKFLEQLGGVTVRNSLVLDMNNNSASALIHREKQGDFKRLMKEYNDFATIVYSG